MREKVTHLEGRVQYHRFFCWVLRSVARRDASKKAGVGVVGNTEGNGMVIWDIGVGGTKKCYFPWGRGSTGIRG
eukprot:764141-Hanusia_phi.AAC.3